MKNKSFENINCRLPYLSCTQNLAKCFLGFIRNTTLISLTVISQAATSETIHIIDDTKQVYGKIEYMRIMGNDKKLKTKLDTGAKISSINATDIEVFKKSGKNWARFNVRHDKYDIKIPIELPIVRYAKIKNRTNENGSNSESSKISERPVVNMTMCLGSKKEVIEVNLIDRSHFVYPMLLGSDAIIDFKAIIDPSRKFTAKSVSCD